MRTMHYKGDRVHAVSFSTMYKERGEVLALIAQGASVIVMQGDEHVGTFVSPTQQSEQDRGSSRSSSGQTSIQPQSNQKQIAIKQEQFGNKTLSPEEIAHWINTATVDETSEDEEEERKQKQEEEDQERRKAAADRRPNGDANLSRSEYAEKSDIFDDFLLPGATMQPPTP